MCTSRLASDLYASSMGYWYPDGDLQPPHIVNLIQVQSRLRAERESHTVTYSSEDDAGIHYTPKDVDYLGSDRDPMFVIVDSSCVSNPSSRELLIDSRFNSRDTILRRNFNRSIKPLDVPSTSRDVRNDILPSQMKETDSSDEMQMVDINLQSDNDILVGDIDSDSDSIVISYLRNKDMFLDLEEISEDSLDVVIPSFPGSPRSYLDEIVSVDSLYSSENINMKYKKAIAFLHHDHEFLEAAELGDHKKLRILIDQRVDIHYKDHLGRNALHLAVCSGNRYAVAMLLTAGVDPTIKDNLGMTPLSLCLMRRPSLRMATLLFDHGAVLLPRITPTDTGLFLQFVMMCIPTKEEERILRLLVEKGALVNDPEAPGGRQALHFAAMSNNTSLINILIDLGADLFSVNHRNQTPKQVAAVFLCKQAYALLDQYEILHDEEYLPSQSDTSEKITEESETFSSSRSETD
uniref:Uncharacterized protein n=1 Tax=Heliothis virescens TaxID=7102 RepID=A0A2A4KBB5_HELVI